MQIEKLVLYSHAEGSREVEFRLGELNIITGASQTGKSSLTNIFRYCLGSSRPDVPVGAISGSVAWYGMVVRIGEKRLFLGRPAANGDGEISAALLIIEPDELPVLGALVPNTTAAELREYLAGAIGIEENLNVPVIGQTRAALAANFVHSLYYCFQGQGEIANPEVLFHRQNREWQAQAIRDTLPYFLGAQGLDDLRRRQQLSEQRRQLRRAEQLLARADTEVEEGADRSQSLLIEANDVGLLSAEEVELLDDMGADQGRGLLQTLIDRPIEAVRVDTVGVSFEDARLELADQRERAREIVNQLHALENFREVASGYESELDEHRSRLASIGLIPRELETVDCPICGNRIGTEERGDDFDLVEGELAAVTRRLDLADRDRPRIEKARAELLDEREGVLARIAELNQTLSSLAETNEVVSRERQRINLQSYVRGKIAQYLESIVQMDASELTQLRTTTEELRASVADVEASLDPALVRSRVESAVARVNRQLTQFAQDLGLEHSEDGVRVDPNRLTVVADTENGPAYLDSGQIGSGLNWVGYHLATYLALQGFFIDNQRPVPSFVLIDQPSQAFFPRDRRAGGDLEELTDTDRENTKNLYRLMYDTVASHDGALQIIALDHADFDEDWFQDCVVERWRDGRALIPESWLGHAAGEDENSREFGGSQPPAD